MEVDVREIGNFYLMQLNENIFCAKGEGEAYILQMDAEGNLVKGGVMELPHPKVSLKYGSGYIEILGNDGRCKDRVRLEGILDLPARINRLEGMIRSYETDLSNLEKEINYLTKEINLGEKKIESFEKLKDKLESLEEGSGFFGYLSALSVGSGITAGNLIHYFTNDGRIGFVGAILAGGAAFLLGMVPLDKLQSWRYKRLKKKLHKKFGPALEKLEVLRSLRKERSQIECWLEAYKQKLKELESKWQECQRIAEIVRNVFYTPHEYGYSKSRVAELSTA